MKRAAILHEIDTAFAESEAGSERIDCIMLNASHPETLEVGQLFLGRRWQDIPDAVFDVGYPTPFVLNAEAIGHYLPAFLTAAIRYEDDYLARRVFSALLNPPKKAAPTERFTQQFAHLTRSQRLAVAHAIDFFAEAKCSRDARFRRQATDAIERYWANASIPVSESARSS